MTKSFALAAEATELFADPGHSQLHASPAQFHCTSNFTVSLDEVRWL